MTPVKARREDALKDYLQVVAALPVAAPAQRLAWAREWKAGNAEAGRSLLESFLPMVVAEAAARRGDGPRFETLLSTGNKALSGTLSKLRNEPQDLEKSVRHAIIGALRAFKL